MSVIVPRGQWRMRTADICYRIAETAFIIGDALLDLPPGVEARHHLGRQIMPPATSYYDD